MAKASKREPPEGRLVSDTSLPSRYATDSLLLLPRDPRSIFYLWELSSACIGAAPPEAGIYLCSDDGTALRLDGSLSSGIGSGYVEALEPGRRYWLELLHGDGTRASPPLRSREVNLPPEAPTERGDHKRAQIPFSAPLARFATPRRAQEGAHEQGALERPADGARRLIGSSELLAKGRGEKS